MEKSPGNWFDGEKTKEKKIYIYFQQHKKIHSIEFIQTIYTKIIEKLFYALYRHIENKIIHILKSLLIFWDYIKSTLFLKHVIISFYAYFPTLLYTYANYIYNIHVHKYTYRYTCLWSTDFDIYR